MEENTWNRNAPAEWVITQYQNMVYRLAVAKMGNRQEAEDVFQEVFLRYLKKQPAFASEEHRKAWLLRVTINCCKKHLLSPWKKRTEPLCEDLVFQEPEREWVFQELLKLPDLYREVLHLFYYEDMSTEEIAVLLKRKKSTVRTQLTRARACLKEILEEEGYGKGNL